MENDSIKNAFSKVKDDILCLKEEMDLIRLEVLQFKYSIEELRSSIGLLTNDLNYIRNNITTNTTDLLLNSTNPINKTDNSTVPQEIGGSKMADLITSTGNRGVQTDSQTVRQTVNTTQEYPQKQLFPYSDIQDSLVPNSFDTQNNSISIEHNIRKATDILDSLDNLKKEIRLKFKRITTQEMLVFSTIYQLEEISLSKATYPEIAERLNLTQSSIRDYVQRLISKGIPIKKEKINNRKVILRISPDLKRIATLSTIISLREL